MKNISRNFKNIFNSRKWENIEGILENSKKNVINLYVHFKNSSGLKHEMQQARMQSTLMYVVFMMDEPLVFAMKRF